MSIREELSVNTNNVEEGWGYKHSFLLKDKLSDVQQMKQKEGRLDWLLSEVSVITSELCEARLEIKSNKQKGGILMWRTVKQANLQRRMITLWLPG